MSFVEGGLWMLIKLALLVTALGGAYSIIMGIVQLRPSWVGLGIAFVAPYALLKYRTGSDLLQGYREGSTPDSEAETPES